MPDFEAMTDLELRQYKSAQHRLIQEARANMLAAQVVLERLRKEADAAWAQQAATATAAVDAASTIVDAPAASAAGRTKIR